MAAAPDVRPLPDRNELAFVQRWRAVIDIQMHLNDMRSARGRLESVP